MTKEETTIPTKQHRQLLQKVKTIMAYHKELTKAKGELFNIYEILNLRTKEVRTHSAFIAELLNPKGTHLMGSTFLDAFIALLPKAIFEKHLDIESTTVTVEYFIGAINNKNKTGGRIDIFLKDAKDHSISIENKIDADDQDFQVLRYYNYNYNTTKNRVVYLSKFGEEPSEKSIGVSTKNTDSEDEKQSAPNTEKTLEAGKDFYVIGYQNEIISWLETCQALAYDQPIVRESIKQYKILIQKITKTLGNKQNAELKKVVIDHLEEASQIASKYQQVVNKIKNDFRDTILNLLLLEFKAAKYDIQTRKKVDKPFSSIWFFEAIHTKNKTWFAIESFSGEGNENGILYVGIYTDNPNFTIRNEFNKLNKWWPHYKPLMHDDKTINMSDSGMLKTLSNPERMEAIAKSVATQIIEFVKKYEHFLTE